MDKRALIFNEFPLVARRDGNEFVGQVEVRKFHIYANKTLEISHEILDIYIMSEPVSERKKEKNPAAVALSKLGASKGGKARAAKLSPKKRSLIAKKAAAARWTKE